MSCYEISLKKFTNANNKETKACTIINIGILYIKKKNFDIALNCPQEALIIQKEIDDKEMEGIIEYMQTFKLKKGIIVTKNTIGRKKIENNEIYLIPAPILLTGIK